MAYENDIIMRQVRDMTRMLAKILFGKNTATYEYKEEDRHTATDSLYARLIALVDAGKINEAENRLYEELERDEEGTFEVSRVRIAFNRNVRCYFFTKKTHLPVTSRQKPVVYR